MTDITSFFIAGLNYKKSDAAIRGRFSINSDQYAHIISLAKEQGLCDFFVLSTCNRTEIFGFASSQDQLPALLCSQTEGSLEEFKQVAYQKSGIKAIEHLFNVAAGLDSQILGDYEIVGQIKLAIKFSKEHTCMSPYLERMVNEVLQACKKVRTTTAMSSGTVSVSFAAVQFARTYFGSMAGKQIVLLGTGKIGSNTCKNIVDYLPGATVTLVNRTNARAEELAEKFQLAYAPFDELHQKVATADLVIVATNADEPIILEEHVAGNGPKLVIDLSVPYNVSPALRGLENVVLMNVDELSKIKDETLQKRKQEIPKVKMIIAEHIESYITWHEQRIHVPVLKAVKTHLQKMHVELGYQLAATPVFVDADRATREKIQKAINGMAIKMRTHNSKGCHYIEAMNDFIASASN